MKDFMKQTGVTSTLIYMFAISLLLTGCGGGGGTVSNTGVNSGGSAVTAFSAGTVTGFGSIIIDGVRHDDSIAQINQEIDPSMPTAGTAASVKLGMKVETALDNQDRITTLSIQPEVRGQISTLATDGFTVAAQSIKVPNDLAAPTVFEGANSLTDLAVGDFVEVHGSRDASGNIIATRIEREDPGKTAGIRVVGIIANLDTTAKTFTIAALKVDYSSATLLPAGATLMLGQRVAVWSDTTLSDTTLKAKVVRIKTPQISEGSSVRLGGRISGIGATGLTFSLGSVTVDASKATLINGTATDLTNGSLIRVIGVWQLDRVVATEVRFVKEKEDASVELNGAVTDFVSVSSFMLRGMLVDASAARFSGGTIANLADGVLIKIEGHIDGGAVKASSVEFVTISSSGKNNENRTFPGTVLSYNATSGAFTLTDINLAMQINETTKFYNADGSVASKADFLVGKRVRVRGNFVGGVLIVSAIRFTPMSGATSVRVEGALYALDTNASSFQLNGVVIVYNVSTVFENGSATDLANGVRIHAIAASVSGQLVASKIEIQHSITALVEARGAIDGFVSSSKFMVAGQSVDASSTSVKFEDGAAGDLANGRIVEVTGTLSGTTLIANRLEFKD